MNLKYLILILISSLLVQCSTTSTLTKGKYIASTDMIAAGDITGAIKEFPSGEKNYFITTMEKTYLSLLAGRPEIEKLSKFARDDENRIRYKLSREVKSLLYVSTPEGYYPSEHEIIWMHMLLSWGYSLKGDYEKAYIEAKESSNLLKMEWSEEGRFDDPFIRIILGALWAMCGNWDEAQVDFRRASVIDPSLKLAGELGNLTEHPKNLIIILGGIGPEPFLKNKSLNNIQFQSRGKKSSLYIKDNYNSRININLTPDSSRWYKRHLQRNHELHDIIKDTQYAAMVGSETTKTTLRTTGGILAGAAIIAAGLAAGGAIIYVSFLGKLSIEAIYGGIIAGVGVAGYCTYKGIDVMNQSVEYAGDASVFPDTSRYYRYVRFLPEYAWVGWSNKILKYPLKVYHGKELVYEIDESSGIVFRGNDIVLSFYPDSNTEKTVIKKYEDILLKAVKENDIAAIKKMVGSEVNSNTKISDKKYLLHHAVINNRINICEFLLNLDTKIDCLDPAGDTPLHYAINNKFYDIASLLIRNGANVNLRNYSHVSPLALAVSKEKSYNTVKELLSKGASVESADDRGWKVIHYAALQNDIRNIRLLIDKGAYLKAKTLNGETPLRIARDSKNMSVVGLLEQYDSAD